MRTVATIQHNDWVMDIKQGDDDEYTYTINGVTKSDGYHSVTEAVIAGRSFMDGADWAISDVQALLKRHYQS